MKSFRGGALVLMLCTLPAALSAAPGASGATPVPEPSDLALFAIGVAGIIIGRRVVRGRRDKD